MATNPLTSTLAALLEKSASAALALDADTRATLVPLDGQVLLLRVTPITGAPEVALRLTCQARDGGSLSIMADSADSAYASNPPNTIVSGPLQALLSTLSRPGAELHPDVTIEGDERLLATLQRCFRELRPDWREQLDALVDRFAGSTGSQGLQDVLGQAELAFATLRTAVGDALGQSRPGGETGDANSAGNRFWTSEDQLDGFANRLEDLTLKIDRLNARTEQLEAGNRGSGI